MTTTTVTVGGTTATNVVAVDFENATGDTIGSAEITVANSQTNRSLFASGESVTIDVDGSTEWRGEVVGKPSNAAQDNLTLTVKAETKAGQAEYGKVTRPFIQVSRAQMLRDAIDHEIEVYKNDRKITHADVTDGWAANDDVDVLELLDDSKGVNKFGKDTIFVAFLEDSTGTPSVTFNNVPANAVPGRQLLTFETRFVINNRGDIFDVAVELTDDDGITYRWTPDVAGNSEFKTYEFDVEDATVTSGGTPRTLQYIFDIDGILLENRAAAIDMARTTPFKLNDRATGLSHAIDDTDDTITRRVDDSILRLANVVAIEAGGTVYVDDTETLRFDDTPPPAAHAIDDTTDAGVVDVDVDRDFNDVINVVTVQGKDDQQATFQDSASIQFYNDEAPRPEPLTDTSLRTHDQLEDRARGYLREHAWEDSAIEFTLAGAKWRDVAVGEVIPVTWPKEDISGSFVVDRARRNQDGFTVLGMSGNTET